VDLGSPKKGAGLPGGGVRPREFSGNYPKGKPLNTTNPGKSPWKVGLDVPPYDTVTKSIKAVNNAVGRSWVHQGSELVVD